MKIRLEARDGMAYTNDIDTHGYIISYDPEYDKSNYREISEEEYRAILAREQAEAELAIE